MLTVDHSKIQAIEFEALGGYQIIEPEKGQEPF